MKMKKLTGILMAGMLMASMAGCGAVSVDGETKTDAPAASEDGEGAGGSGAIGLAVSTLNNPFFVTLSEGAQARSEEHTSELQSPS